MLKDPIVIRKAKNNYIIAATKPEEPIQLIRQLDETRLEVHLKNGITYIEEVTEENREQVVLELMGFRHEELIVEFKTWPTKMRGFLYLEDLNELSESDRMETGDGLISHIYVPTPFVSSKFVSLEILKT